MNTLHALLSTLNVTSKTAVFILLWLLIMIFVPIANWVWGEAAMLRLVSAGVVAQATAVLLILIQAWGWQETVKTAVLTALTAYTVEWIGSHTGWPFGSYYYTPTLQPQLGGVPLLIPLAWLMMLPCAWATVAHYAGWRFTLLAAFAFTAWDLMLDPQMVGWGLWVWQQPGGYFGIPWLNFVGWILTAVFLTALLRPKPVPVRPLLLIYTLTWFLETFGLAFFWAMPGPAAVGGVVMGVFVWLGWKKNEIKRLRDWEIDQSLNLPVS